MSKIAATPATTKPLRPRAAPDAGSLEFTRPIDRSARAREIVLKRERTTLALSQHCRPLIQASTAK